MTSLPQHSIRLPAVAAFSLALALGACAGTRASATGFDGSPRSGGAVARGGTTSAGDTVPTGGNIQPSGGTTSAGSATPSGGTADSGGSKATGGAPGGTAVTGGTTAVGGSIPTGGTTATGGTTVSLAAFSFYVSPTGSDSNDGATAATPWNTLERARDYIRSSNLNNTATGDIVVYLRGGTYPRTTTFTLTSADSGPNGNYMVYRAYPGEIPVIDAGKAITGWTQVAGKPYFVADVSVSAGYAGYFRQLYVNNVRAQRAGKFLPQDGWWDDPATASYAQDGIKFKKTDLLTLANPAAAVVTFFSAFKTAEIPITGMSSLDANDWVLGIENPDFNKWSSMGRATSNEWVELSNVLEYLDEYGEWYLDAANGKVYYYPQPWEDMASASVYAPVVDCPWKIAGTRTAKVSRIMLDGLTFEHNNWSRTNGRWIGGSQAEMLWGLDNAEYTDEVPGALVLTHANSSVVRNCVFEHLGTCGVQLYDGCDGATIQGNYFFDCTAAGVIVGRSAHLVTSDPTSETQRNTNTLVSNNVVRNTGSDFTQATGIDCIHAENTRVYNNDISDIPFAGYHNRTGQFSAHFPAPAIAGKSEIFYNRSSHVGTYRRYASGDAEPDYYTFGPEPIHFTKNYAYGQVPIGLSNSAQIDDNSLNVLMDFSVLDSKLSRNSFLSWSSGNVNVATDNLWSNNASYQSTNCTTTNYHYVVGAWPSDAQAVIDNSGVEASYQSLVGGTYGGDNVALEAVASASSSASGHGPGLGNDVGNKTYWQSGDASNNPWFMLDLGSAYVIQKLELEPALLTDVDLTSFEIQASNDAGFAAFVVLAAQNATQFRHRGDLGYNDMFWYIEHDKNAYRYIRVYKTAGTQLALADLRVYVKGSSTAAAGP
jgi:F5/8 type C domain/Right handed beta helix region